LALEAASNLTTASRKLLAESGASTGAFELDLFGESARSGTEIPIVMRSTTIEVKEREH
jgi:hypothetical protein